MKRINWKLLACHFLAIPFLVIGAQQLQLIRWVPLLKAYQKQGVEGVAQQSGSMAETVAALWMGSTYALVLAVVAGCVLSGIIIGYRSESWLIPVFLFLLGITSSWTRYYKSEFVTNGLALMRWPFEVWSLETRLAIIGSLLSAVGLALLLLTKNKRRLRI